MFLSPVSDGKGQRDVHVKTLSLLTKYEAHISFIITGAEDNSEYSNLSLL